MLMAANHGRAGADSRDPNPKVYAILPVL